MNMDSRIPKNAAYYSNPPMHWSLGLIASINDPASILEEDDYTFVIKDYYPKARFHYLILPKKDIPSIEKVTRDDLQILKHMESVAHKFVQKHENEQFQIGYHALPHMHRLHLHVISTDFDSPYLKTKKHWNTFMTPYFIPSEDVCKQVEKYGYVNIDVQKYEAYLRTSLKCHKCPNLFTNIAGLKEHLMDHN
ncbi:hypothetical protein TKK_0007842 [Trichogramma kaykai]|uniref:HIT domain-containing protein n=1 Tax=Trichogramma kaykai TaxID=54128 RepID=A0ABD2X884_9HYME